MCGIAGFLSPGRSIPSESLLRASHTLRHRGPDGDGFVFWSPDMGPLADRTSPDGGFSSGAARGLLPRAGLMHRRLAITAISPPEAGHQPFSDPEGRYWLAFNGEIYNYQTLRRQLEDEGCQFRTRTDTEVLLQAYRVWGAGCLSRLDGMWAFAILDLQSRCLFAAVDRSGVKPFYFARSGEDLLFASEIKALRDLGVSLSPNEEILARYLAYGFSDESDLTFFKGIFRLRAGHSMEMSLDGGAPRLTVWHNWQVSTGSGLFSAQEEERRAARIAAHLQEAVRLRLRADVPVGLCLSGGLDSSLIAAAVAAGGQAAGRKAFMARLPGSGPSDEYPFARQMAMAAGLQLITITPETADLEENLEDMLFHLDEPPPGLNAFSQYAVFRCMHREGMRVSLDGQGADELFGGYPRHMEMAAVQSIRQGRLPSLQASLFPALWNELRDRLPLARAMELLRLAKPEYRSIRFGVLCMAGPKGQHFSTLNEGLLAEFSSRSLPFLLKAADRNSMRWSVESRMPFADYHPLAEEAFSIPGLAKVAGGQRKRLLRLAAPPLVPRAIRDRSDKVAFAAPDRLWLQALLASPRWQNLNTLSGYIDLPVFEKQRKLFIRNPASADPGVLWRVFAAQIWAQLFSASGS